MVRVRNREYFREGSVLEPRDFGVTLPELREIGGDETFLVLDINRGDQIIVPRGGDSIEVGDRLHILCPAEAAPRIPSIIHRRRQVVDTVIIGGASRYGVQVAAAIQDEIERVVLIEPDPDAAEMAASNLKRTLVLQGDPADLDVLEEASLETCDLFCALSDDDQANTMSALLAKKHTDTLAAVLVQQPEYVPVLNSLGIEIVINPRLATAGEILQHVRRGQVRSVTRLVQNRAEILELEAVEDSLAVRAPLKDLAFPEHALLGAIVREGVMCIPTAESEIEPGDRVARWRSTRRWATARSRRVAAARRARPPSR